MGWAWLLAAVIAMTGICERGHDDDCRVVPSGELKPVAWRYVHHDYAGRKVSRYGSHAERVNGRDPIETHPLYGPEALEAAFRLGLEAAADIAKAIDSGRGNEKEIATAILAIDPAQHLGRE